jgi:hypothetical protein
MLILRKGFIFRLKSFLPPTKKPFVHLVLLVRDQEERVLTVHPVEIGMITARRRAALLRDSEPNTLVSVGVHLGSKP